MASLSLVLDEEEDVRQGEGGLALATGQQVLLQRGVSVVTQPGQPAHCRSWVVPIEAAALLRVLRAALRQLLRRDDGRGEGLSCWQGREGEPAKRKREVGGQRVDEQKQRKLECGKKATNNVLIFFFFSLVIESY